MTPTLTPVGEDAILVEYEPKISLDVNRQVRQLAHGLEKLPGITEVIPAYRSLMVYFDAGFDEVRERIEHTAQHLKEIELPAPRHIVIPTVFNGPDLDRVAQATGLTAAAVVQLFTAQRYPVYCLGFLCSLAYMGGLPEQLRFPRLATPRTKVRAGSVGIAGEQIVILPVDMPSGFHYLGHTTMKLYDPHQMPPTPIVPGDLIQFESVTHP